MIRIFIFITILLFAKDFCFGQAIKLYKEVIDGKQNSWKRINIPIEKRDTLLVISSGVVSYGIFAGRAYSNGFDYPLFVNYNLKGLNLVRHGSVVIKLNNSIYAVDPVQDIIADNGDKMDGILSSVSISSGDIGLFIIANENGYLEALINDNDANNNSGYFNLEIYKKEGCKIPYSFKALPDCPCNISSVIANMETSCPSGKWEEYTVNDKFHIGASQEYRWLPMEAGMPGQQCTYDHNGNLIAGGFAAGTPDRVSPSGVSYAPEHYVTDVQPFSEVPCKEYMKNWPPNQGRGCGRVPNIINGGLINALGDKINCSDLIRLLQIAQQHPFACKHILQVNNGLIVNRSLLKTELEELLNLLNYPIYLSDNRIVLNIYKSIFL